MNSNLLDFLNVHFMYEMNRKAETPMKLMVSEVQMKREVMQRFTFTIKPTKVNEMGLKNQITKSEHLEWERFQLLLHQMERDGEITFYLLFALGGYTGLRISDILDLTWKELIEADKISVIEKKTRKKRVIDLNQVLKEIINKCYQGQNLNEYVFRGAGKDGKLSVQHVNRKIKTIFSKYKIRGRYSSHFMRKTLGRRVWEQNGCSEKALILLSDILQHSSLKMTKIYLNITEEEIRDVYINL
jgi:integrase